MSARERRTLFLVESKAKTRRIGRTNVAFQGGPASFEVRLATASSAVLIPITVPVLCPSKVAAMAIIIVVAISRLLPLRAVGVVAAEIGQDFVRRQVNVVNAIRVNLRRKRQQNSAGK
jgi:hypothetical protein